MSVRGRSGGGAATTVFVVAASDVVRAGLESLVADDARFTVVGGAAELSGIAAFRTEGAPPDVVVLDADGQEGESLAALRSFADEADEGDALSVFVVIGEQGGWVAEALRAGVVRALLPRAATGGEIVAAVEAVSAGLFAFDAETFALLLARSATPPDDPLAAGASDERPPPVEPELDALTPREREVLDMLAEGLSNKEIAWRMSISEHTVKFHVAAIFAKLDVSTRTEAVVRGVRRGLVMM